MCTLLLIPVFYSLLRAEIVCRYLVKCAEGLDLGCEHAVVGHV